MTQICVALVEETTAALHGGVRPLADPEIRADRVIDPTCSPSCARARVPSSSPAAPSPGAATPTRAAE
jgi:hypothetical protein